MRILPCSARIAVSASGRLGFIPVSLINDVVTIKKINIMNTISIIGVILISLSSSSLLFFLNMIISVLPTRHFLPQPNEIDRSL
jgi:hypothetical protein